MDERCARLWALLEDASQDPRVRVRARYWSWRLHGAVEADDLVQDALVRSFSALVSQVTRDVPEGTPTPDGVLRSPVAYLCTAIAGVACGIARRPGARTEALLDREDRFADPRTQLDPGLRAIEIEVDPGRRAREYAAQGERGADWLATHDDEVWAAATTLLGRPRSEPAAQIRETARFAVRQACVFPGTVELLEDLAANPRDRASFVRALQEDALERIAFMRGLLEEALERMPYFSVPEMKVDSRRKRVSRARPLLSYLVWAAIAGRTEPAEADPLHVAVTVTHRDEMRRPLDDVAREAEKQGPCGGSAQQLAALQKHFCELEEWLASYLSGEGT